MTKKRIIVEGPDGAGKTTLVKQLMELLPEAKLIVNTEKAHQNFYGWWPDMLQLDGGILLHDRFFYSEMVYGPLLRGRLAVDMKFALNVREAIRSHAFLIYCRPPSHKVEQGLLANEQMEGVNSNIIQIIEGYDAIMMQEHQWYENRFFQYSWTHPAGFARLESALRKYLEVPP